MKLELIRKFVRDNLNDFDNHLSITELTNQIDALSTIDADSLKDEMFDQRKFEMLLNEMAIDEDKTSVENFFW